MLLVLIRVATIFFLRSVIGSAFEDSITSGLRCWCGSRWRVSAGKPSEPRQSCSVVGTCFLTSALLIAIGKYHSTL